MSVDLKVSVTIKGERYIARVPICEAVIQRITEEIVSFVNRRGAQWNFSVHDPTPEQLVKHYINTGGLQQCIDAMGPPSAFVMSVSAITY